VHAGERNGFASYFRELSGPGFCDPSPSHPKFKLIPGLAGYLTGMALDAAVAVEIKPVL
jgi:hypothetical protein